MTLEYEDHDFNECTHGQVNPNHFQLSHATKSMENKVKLDFCQALKGKLIILFELKHIITVNQDH